MNKNVMLNEVVLCKCGCGKIRLKTDNQGRVREYINGHFNKGKKHEIKTCVIQGCIGICHAKGYCDKHYQRFKKYKNPLFIKNISGKNNHQYGKISPMKGKKHSKETKIKMSKSMTGIKRSEESKLRMKITNRGKIMSEEGRRKTSERMAKKAIVFSNTKPERFLKSVLSVNGIKYESQKIIRVGNRWHPVDIFIKPNICIEADGCFHHACLKYCTEKQLKYSAPQKALKRDPMINQKLKDRGYMVLRFWQHEIDNDIMKCFDEITEFIK